MGFLGAGTCPEADRISSSVEIRFGELITHTRIKEVTSSRDRLVRWKGKVVHGGGMGKGPKMRPDLYPAGGIFFSSAGDFVKDRIILDTVRKLKMNSKRLSCWPASEDCADGAKRGLRERSAGGGG